MLDVTFTEDVTLKLRRARGKGNPFSRRFFRGETVGAEFLGEDADLSSIDFELPDATLAIAVPRHVVDVAQSRG